MKNQIVTERIKLMIDFAIYTCKNTSDKLYYGQVVLDKINNKVRRY